MFSSLDSSESTNLSLIPEVPLTLVGMPSASYILQAWRFLPLLSMEQWSQQKKSPACPQNAAACNSTLTVYSACSQSDYSRVLYWLPSAYSSSCLYLTQTLCHLISLFFGTFLYTSFRTLLHRGNKLHCKVVSWNSPGIAFQINSNLEKVLPCNSQRNPIHLSFVLKTHI